MDVTQVPQEDNKTLGGQRKAMYAKDSNGHIVVIASNGWEVEEIVTSAAVNRLKQLADTARTQVRDGHTSPLEYWMYVKRMDIAILAQSTGFWRWRIRRHFRPNIFNALPQATLQRYADALGISTEQLKQPS